MFMRPAALSFSLLAVVALAACQNDRSAPAEGSSTSVEDTVAPAVVRRDTAGSMTIQRAPNNPRASLNAGSSLRRRHIAVQDTSLPIELTGTPGLSVVFLPGTSIESESYSYTTEFTTAVEDSVTAFEVRYVLFDVWGELQRVVGASKIKDLPPGDTSSWDVTWESYGKNAARVYYASIAYISQVRTPDGRVLKANETAVLREARRFADSFSRSDLTPEEDQPDDS